MQDAKGRPVNVTSKWLSSGWGIERRNCTLMPAWNAWSCSEKNYCMMVIENMDRDHVDRRISPIALSTPSGYTMLMNG
jgi:hypothetical protein